MKILFLHLGDKSIDGNTLSHSPLGGTETALIGMSVALAKNPENEVHVFTNTPVAAEFSGVNYHPIKTLATWSRGESVDVFISIRQWLPMALPVKAKLRVYFSPDAFDQPAVSRAFDVGFEYQGEKLVLPLFAANHFFENVDSIFCVGDWQAKTFKSEHNFPAEKIHVTANGVFLNNFEPRVLQERHTGIVYSATPFRGLNHLITMIPELRRLVPSLSVEVCSGMGVYGASQEEDQKTYGLLYQALNVLHAKSHGSILQSELAKIMCANRVYTYPNTFAETFCISVLEAQAAALPVVTSRKGALPERVTSGVDGFLIDGNPGEESYTREFISATQRLLTDDILWQQFSCAARKKSESFTYDCIAKNWTDFFSEQLKSRAAATLPPDMSLFKVTDVKIPHPSKPNQMIPLDQNSIRMILTQAVQPYGFVL